MTNNSVFDGPDREIEIQIGDNVSAWLDLDHGVAPPAFLCHYLIVIGLASKAPLVGMSCPTLVLYGIRAPIIGSLGALKPCHK